MKHSHVQDNYYLDNKKFLEALIDYREKRKIDPNTRISDYIGKCILLICNKLGTRSNFNQYTYLDEMVSDAIEDCLAAVKNFDPTITGKAGNVNPFGYFGFVAWRAFIQRINTEKEQQYLKHKNFQNQHLLFDHEGDIGSCDLSDQVIDDFEERLKKAKEKALTKKEKPAIIEPKIKKTKRKENV